MLPYYVYYYLQRVYLKKNIAQQQLLQLNVMSGDGRRTVIIITGDVEHNDAYGTGSSTFEDS